MSSCCPLHGDGDDLRPFGVIDVLFEQFPGRQVRIVSGWRRRVGERAVDEVESSSGTSGCGGSSRVFLFLTIPFAAASD
jgi:hypothetical protein